MEENKFKLLILEFIGQHIDNNPDETDRLSTEQLDDMFRLVSSSIERSVMDMRKKTQARQDIPRRNRKDAQ